MTVQPTLRLATGEDASGIARLSRDRIEHGLGWSWTTPRVMRSIRDRATNVVVAHGDAEDGTGDARMLGFGIMKYHDDESHLLLLAVQPGVVRRGIGASMMNWLEHAALIAGIGQVYLEARLTNGGARAFYARLGYREIQTLPGYYDGREACVRLAKDLWLTRAAPA